jgi:predicted RNA binding protein YcfA (HicA-like mRNA interferase family)
VIEQDGWQLAKTKGSRRQYEYPDKPDPVTVPGKPGDELFLDTPNAILKQN